MEWSTRRDSITGEEYIRGFGPTICVGALGTAGQFTGGVVRALWFPTYRLVRYQPGRS